MQAVRRPPFATGSSGGRTSAQRSVDHAHRGSNGQPAGASSAETGWPGITFRAPTGPVERGARAQQAPGVRVELALEHLDAGPVSTMVPAYITSTRSQIDAASSRSWVMNSVARSRSRLQVGEDRHDLGLRGDVEGGGRLVGDQQLGLGDKRAGDHHALEHAAGELIGIRAQAPVGIGDADRVEHRPRALVHVAIAESTANAAARRCGR